MPRFSLRFNLNDPHQKTAWELLYAVPEGQRSAYVTELLYRSATQTNDACKEGAVLVAFIDWRMRDCLYDAIQYGNWMPRGEIVWDKITSRPQRGRYRQQAEFAIWASKGALPMDRPVGCLPGVFRYANPQRRTHVTEKPFAGGCVIWLRGRRCRPWHNDRSR